MNIAAKSILAITKRLRKQLGSLQFDAPVSHVYNPLEYAWSAYEQYILRFATSPCRTMFLGMNPGPWGMAQTGIPFGEIDAVRKYLSIHARIDRPAREHPKRPILGFECKRSEVSGKRLWGLMESRYGNPEDFFKSHYIANYCPLVFMDSGARNLTPDKITGDAMVQLETACDQHLQQLLEILRPEFAIGVGAYAYDCLKRVCHKEKFDVNVNKILHPSPASPAANRDWAGQATRQLQEIGVW